MIWGTTIFGNIHIINVSLSYLRVLTSYFDFKQEMPSGKDVPMIVCTLKNGDFLHIMEVINPYSMQIKVNCRSKVV